MGGKQSALNNRDREGQTRCIIGNENVANRKK